MGSSDKLNAPFENQPLIVRVLKDDHSEAKPNELGRIVVKLPLPPGTIQGLWENDELFKHVYFEEYPG